MKWNVKRFITNLGNIRIVAGKGIGGENKGYGCQKNEYLFHHRYLHKRNIRTLRAYKTNGERLVQHHLLWTAPVGSSVIGHFLESDSPIEIPHVGFMYRAQCIARHTITWYAQSMNIIPEPADGSAAWQIGYLSTVFELPDEMRERLGCAFSLSEIISSTGHLDKRQNMSGRSILMLL